GAILVGVVLVAHVLFERKLETDPTGCTLPFDSRLKGGIVSLCWGIPLVLLLTVPWFCWVQHETSGEFFRVFFWHHNVERGLGGSEDLRAHPWWFYGPRWLMDFLPWSPLVLLAGWYCLRRGWWRDDPDARFGLIWFGSMFVVLSCARFKRADYLLP